LTTRIHAKRSALRLNGHLDVSSDEIVDDENSHCSADANEQ
jgi:hypothetical protein